MTVTQDDGVESRKANAQCIRIATQHFALAGVEENPPVVGLDQHRQPMFGEHVGGGNVVVRQHGDSQPLDHRGASDEVSTPSGASLQRSSCSCRRAASAR